LQARPDRASFHFRKSSRRVFSAARFSFAQDATVHCKLQRHFVDVMFTTLLDAAFTNVFDRHWRSFDSSCLWRGRIAD
jgi:hypothetical protein